MPHEPAKKVRIIVAFGDISGFTHFCESVTHDEIEYDPFMAKFDDLLDQAERATGYAFTDTGDGFMCTVDLDAGHNCTKTIEVLKNLWRLLKRIERLVDGKEPPRPDGFRIVGAAGYVKRKVKRDGRVVLRGKHINLAHNLLDSARGKGFVCHDSLKQLINEQQAKKNGIVFERLDHLLWTLKITG